METHPVRIGDIIFASAPDKLEALALGSCIGLIIYDPVLKLGAMAHILLPEDVAHDSDNKLGKYATTAIPETIRTVMNKGGKRDRLVAKMAGGARMFELTGKTALTLDVGKRNAEMVRKLLEANNIPILAEDVGNNYGRSVTFDLDVGTLTVKVGLRKILRTI
ncbi:MAG: chemotaxis protein CheD [Candidatus Heimdallarchaeota archaeon]|nr:chemotaxis protein CheD [Candidatus Heimdallarchaeota archaeon]